jgi:hypothetical protein
LTKLAFIRKFRPKRFHQIDPRGSVNSIAADATVTNGPLRSEQPGALAVSEIQVQHPHKILPDIYIHDAGVEVD